MSGAETSSELIDAKIDELDDWRGGMLSRVRSLTKDAVPGVVEEIREAKTLEVFLDLALGREVAAQGEECAVDHVHGPDCNH